MTLEEMNHKMLVQVLENQQCLLQNTRAGLNTQWRINHVEGHIDRTRFLLRDIERSSCH
jgi:hypothetical protein